MPSRTEEYVEFKLRTKRERHALYQEAAKQRGLSLVSWIRQVLNEELERQAALIIYQLRIEHPQEINAIVEEIIRQRSTETGESTVEPE